MVSWLLRSRRCTTRRPVGSPATTTPASTPRCSAAIVAANGGHQGPTAPTSTRLGCRTSSVSHFGDRAEAFPVFNGTGANVVSLQAMTQRWQAVICARAAHINVDEGGAPEKVGGLKLLSVATPLRQAHPGAGRPACVGLRRRAPRPAARSSRSRRAPSSAPATPWTRSRRSSSTRTAGHAGARRRCPARQRGGDARRAAACVHDGRRRRRRLFGGTKNGLLLGECVVVLDPDAVTGVDSSAQVGDAAGLQDAVRLRPVRRAAVRRPVAAQRPARQRDGAAARGRRCATSPASQLMRPVQANAVFAILPVDVTERLQKRYPFYVWDEATGEVRWMALVRHDRGRTSTASPRRSPPRWSA